MGQMVLKGKRRCLLKDLFFDAIDLMELQKEYERLAEEQKHLKIDTLTRTHTIHSN